MSMALRRLQTPPRRDRAPELVAASSIEISPRDEFAGERLRELFDPGTTVFVNHPGSVTHHDIVAAVHQALAQRHPNSRRRGRPGFPPKWCCAY